MKKILFATTALALSAGVAAAEVKVGGDGRMGVVYNGKDWDFSSRVRVKFNASAQTDGGLEFGGSIRADNAKDGKQGTAGDVYISGAFGKLSMGDIDSAPKALFGDFDDVGYEGVKDQNGTNKDIPYLIDDDGKQGPRVLYEGTFGDFSIAASMSDGRGTKDGKDTYEAVVAEDTTFSGPEASLSGDSEKYTPTVVVKKGTKIPVTKTKGEDQKNQKFDQELALAAAYSFGDYTVGIGYERIDAAGDGKDKTQFMLNGEATFGNTTVRLAYAKGNKAVWDNAGDIAKAEDKAKDSDEYKAIEGSSEDDTKAKDKIVADAKQGVIDDTKYDGLDKWYGVGVSSVFGATTLTGYVQYKDFDAKTKKDVTWYGIGASYDLGGGATLAAGLAKSDAKGKDDVTADLGIKFKF